MSGSGTGTTSNSCDPNEEDDDIGDDISRGLGPESRSYLCFLIRINLCVCCNLNLYNNHVC